MSLKIVRSAFENKLLAMTGNIQTIFENMDIDPVVGVPYQLMNLIPNIPSDKVIGGATYDERGIMQISLYYPVGVGAGAASSQAELVRTHFTIATTMVESGITVNITGTPRVSPAMIVGDRYVVPISISFQAQIIK